MSLALLEIFKAVSIKYSVSSSTASCETLFAPDFRMILATLALGIIVPFLPIEISLTRLQACKLPRKPHQCQKIPLSLCVESLFVQEDAYIVFDFDFFSYMNIFVYFTEILKKVSSSLCRMSVSIESLERSGLYFSELEDALSHYSVPEELKGQYFTFTSRANEQGKAEPTLMDRVKFPVLDDIGLHLDVLQFAARELDKLPAEYWKSIGQLRLPFYVPMQILEWGKENEFKSGRFTQEAKYYNHFLRNFSWTTSDYPLVHKDKAEQSFRILSTYTELRRYFER